MSFFTLYLLNFRYVARHFPAESKAQVLDMIQRMMGVLKSRIKSASWMQEDTKAAAIKKLGNHKYYMTTNLSEVRNGCFLTYCSYLLTVHTNILYILAY